jgi:hypothetical protein
VPVRLVPETNSVMENRVSMNSPMSEILMNLKQLASMNVRPVRILMNLTSELLVRLLISFVAKLLVGIRIHQLRLIQVVHEDEPP